METVKVDLSKARPVVPVEFVEPEIRDLHDLDRVIEGASNFNYAKLSNGGSLGSFPLRYYFFERLGLVTFENRQAEFSEKEVVAALIRFGQNAKPTFLFFHFDSDRDLPPEIEQKLISKAVAKYDRSKPLYRLIDSWSLSRSTY